jgi:hypothetical protein
VIKPPFDKFLMFDVESVGLHGQGFAVSWVIAVQGEEVAHGEEGCPLIGAYGSSSDREWVKANVTYAVTQDNRKQVIRAFGRVLRNYCERGYAIVTDCGWPVEANFLRDIVDWTDNRDHLPYPLYDLSSVLAALGYDPVGTYARKENELPAHNPLNDARQSARVLLEALAGTLEKPE